MDPITRLRLTPRFHNTSSVSLAADTFPSNFVRGRHETGAIFKMLQQYNSAPAERETYLFPPLFPVGTPQLPYRCRLNASVKIRALRAHFELSAIGFQLSACCGFRSNLDTVQPQYAYPQLRQSACKITHPKRLCSGGRGRSRGRHRQSASSSAGTWCPRPP